jgi:transcriptional regulator with XRE-family HTH domain
MLRDAVIYFIRERNVSVPTILEHVEISRSRLYDYLQGNGKVSATTLTNILMIIGVTADEVMLQIFLSHPETWDNTVVHISRTLKDGGEVNAQFVKDVLVDYKHTRNVDILTTRR